MKNSMGPAADSSTDAPQRPWWPLVVSVAAALAAVSASGPASGIAVPTLAQTEVTLLSTVGTVVTAAALLPL